MINSRNEWDALKRVVVGSATKANWPLYDPVFNTLQSTTTWTETPVPKGPVPQWIIDETNEDLETLCNTLKSLGAEVERPVDYDFVAHDGLYNYCPRDRLIVYGSKIIDPAMMYPCRDLERECLWDILSEADEVITMPRNQGMVLDAANILRLNDTWLFLESSSGNRKAYEWLCEQLPDVKIELCNFYSGVHIDSTIMPLREGVVLLNGTRVNSTNCPEVFKGWNKIYVNNVVEQGFYQYPYASKWIALNVLAVDPNTVIVDKHQTDLIKSLESFNFTVVPQELRHSRTLGGGFHCVTLDLVREHKY